MDPSTKSHFQTLASSQRAADRSAKKNTPCSILFENVFSRKKNVKTHLDVLVM
jgi:hypothetical protein